MTLEFELNRKDWWQASWLHRHTPGLTMRAMRAMPMVGYAAFFVGLTFLVIPPSGLQWVAPVMLMVVGLFLPVHLLNVGHWRTHWAWRQYERLVQPETWTISEDGLTACGTHADVSYRWSIFYRWTENDTVFLLYQTPEIKNIIPKRAFPDERVLTAFRELLERKINGRARGFAVVLGASPVPAIPLSVESARSCDPGTIRRAG